MPRRVSLPAADDLFRPTVRTDSAPDQPAPSAHVREADADAPARREADGPGQRVGRRPSGRVRHDEKMTVYITSDELLDLEHTRLSLRRMQGLAVDRGRLVREAVALVLADYEAHGDDSVLVRRLTEE